MATKKKNLTESINNGMDKFFSANDAQAADEQVTQDAQDVNEVTEAETAQKTAKASKTNKAAKTAKAQDKEEAITDNETLEDQEVFDASEERHTQGRKGMKLPRMNIALTPSQFDFVRVMSRIQGISMTNYIGYLISKEMKNNADVYQKAKELIDSVR